MTQEQKDKLLKYLCAALPYGVMIKVTDVDGFTYDGILQVISKGKLGNGWFRLDISDPIKKAKVKNNTVPLNYIYFKPYLRPMSSMTGEEEKEYKKLQHYLNDTMLTISLLNNWLNEHHFDYNGLIERGLALEAPKNMYKAEE